MTASVSASRLGYAAWQAASLAQPSKKTRFTRSNDAATSGPAAPTSIGSTESITALRTPSGCWRIVASATVVP